MAGLHAASAGAGRLPRRTYAEPICRVVGALWYLSRPDSRAAVRDNLCHVLGRAPSRALVARVFHHGALNYWDTLAMPHFTYEQLMELVDIHGIEHLDHARAAGRGVICAGAHLGSVALVAQILPGLGYPVTGVIEQFEPAEVFDFFAEQRQVLGTRLLPAGAAAAREMLLALRRNEVIGLVTDRDVAGTGPSISFFDAPTIFPEGAAWLSIRTGAPILIAVAVRKAGGRFDAWLEPLPEVQRTGDRKVDILRVTQAVAGRLQYYVANHPEQWTVFQRRWPEAQAG
ncbi:MAG: lysophospholipid acyltransferase family protein [Chloroflexi bacterium]|nr:lysophospholipid acyltransferase family protein [Chloroflexota bacterium]MBV9598442.1 lysophospholipid acyltransferase family protein [Chloroflexota bacterium]